MPAPRLAHAALLVIKCKVVKTYTSYMCPTFYTTTTTTAIEISERSTHRFVSWHWEEGPDWLQKTSPNRLTVRCRFVPRCHAIHRVKTSVSNERQNTQRYMEWFNGDVASKCENNSNVDIYDGWFVRCGVHVDVDESSRTGIIQS